MNRDKLVNFFDVTFGLNDCPQLTFDAERPLLFFLENGMLRNYQLLD